MNEIQRGRLIKAIIDIRRSLQQIASRGELTQGEFLVLRRIRIERESGDRQGDFKALRISQYLSMPPPAVSRIFNSLEARGLIERRINQGNRRSVLVCLTENGEIMLNNAEKRVEAVMDKLMERIGEQDFQKLLCLIEDAVLILSEEEFENNN